MNENRLFRRENYLSKIRGFYDDAGMIKVITGVRRCGKSSLMKTICEELSENGVGAERIVFIDLKRRGFRSVKTQESFEKAIQDSIGGVKGLKYLFIDEIQNVKGFEEVLEGFRLENDCSIFITGSNSYLLSGELITTMTGRYVEFEMFTLTFEEYLEMKRFYGKAVSGNLVEELDKYIMEGGFPKALEYENIADKRRYVSSVVDEIFEKDIRMRVQIRNQELFSLIRAYVMNNFGATMNLSNIVEDLAKKGIKIKRETVSRYVRILLDAKIMYKIQRFDLKSRRSIAGEEKYYLADLSFYFVNNADNRINYGPVLENIVYQYARSKDYAASIGRIGKLECDFILRSRDMEYSYVQVAMTIANSKETEEREFASLEAIRDNYPKYLLTRYDLLQRHNGIMHFNIPDFIGKGMLF